MGFLALGFSLVGIPSVSAIDTCGLNISDSSIFYDDLQERQTSSEQQIILSNLGTVDAILSINATDWTDTVSTSIIDVANPSRYNTFLQIYGWQ